MADQTSQWSAAFISWVTTEAMKGIPQAFPARESHLQYAQAVRTGNSGFVALNPQTETPRVGDIIIYKRSDSRTGRSSLHLNFQSNPWEGPGHGDVVVSVTGDLVTCIGGNATIRADRVARSTRRLTNGKLSSTYLVILRPKSGAPADRIGALVALAEQEYRAWSTNRLTDNMPQSFPYQAKYWRAVSQSFTPTIGTFTPTPSAAIVAPSVGGPGTPGISPFIAANDSLHPHIQYELTRRRNSAETIHSHMPFVKLTSLVEVYSKNVDGGQLGSDEKVAYCPTLGVHGLPITSFEDLYTPVDRRSIVATATRMVDGSATQVNVKVENPDEDPPNIPPPGIVGMNCERSTAGGFGIRGGLFKANLSIKAYSVGQLNVLLKYFLRQGTKVVLEMGRMTSSPGEQSLFDAAGETSNLLGDDPKSTSVKEMFQRFNWVRPKDQILNELKPYVLLEKGQRDLIDGYTYNNLGNYELFIGYVATFKVNYTKENIYNIDLTIHSVQQFEVPTRLGGVRSDPDSRVTVPNQCESIDIMDYFSPTAAYRPKSFLRVLAKCKEGITSTDSDAVALSSKWYSHVVKLRSEGAQVGADGIKRDAFLISWECFVNLILNDDTYGLLGTFQVSAGVDARALSVLRAGLISRIGQNRFGKDGDINSNEVSWNQYLRSTDINVLVINNPVAQATANNQIFAQAIPIIQGGDASDKGSDVEEALTGPRSGDVLGFIQGNVVVGSFDRTAKNTSYLTKGIWINSDAIIQAFSKADTISQGITNLLEEMNSAVQGYWNLQLLSAEPEALGLHVIDAGLSKPVEKPLAPLLDERFVALPLGETLVDRFKTDIAEFTNDDRTPKYLYSFNRKLKRSGSITSPQDTGSELLDIKYEADMPVVIAVQAVAGIGGPAQRGLLSSIDIKELRDIAMFDTFPTSSGDNNAPCASDVTKGTLEIEQIPKSVLTDAEVYAIFNMANAPNFLADKNKSVDDYITEVTDAAYDRWLAASTTTKTETVTTTRLAIRGASGAAVPVEEVTTREVPVPPDEQTQKQIKDALNAAATAIRAVPAQNFEQRNPGVLAVVRSYATSFGKAIELIEHDISVLIKQLDSTRITSQIHPFNASNLTKTTVDLTLPGIGGILLFQAFQVERIPNVLQRGYYIVTKVVHEFSVENGWITKLTGRFRFKPNMQTDEARTPR